MKYVMWHVHQIKEAILLVNFKSISLFGLLSVMSLSAVAIDTVTTEGIKQKFEAEMKNNKWNLVMLWAHDCIPCERQKPMIGKFYEEYYNRGITVHGLSTDSVSNRAMSEALLNSNPTKYNNYFYNGDNFSRDYTAAIGDKFMATPTYLVYDKNGELFGTHVGAITRNMLDDLFRTKATDVQVNPTFDLMR